MEENEDADDMVCDADEDSEDSVSGDEAPDTYLPGKPLGENEVLTYDESCYVMYHAVGAGAPCLSFDVLRDELGENRTQHPLSCTIVAGTQAARTHSNSVIVMRWSNMNKISHAEAEEDESESEDEEEDPVLEAATIKHPGCVNRIRTTQLGGKHIAATWSEQGKVFLWDLSRPLAAVDDPQIMSIYTQSQETPAPIYTYKGHQCEGYALDWSPTTPGVLASGDCNNNLHLWKPVEATWEVDTRVYSGHSGSVEDVQWSPNEPSVFSSCSVDKSIRVWDSRAAKCMITTENAHDNDVNVINWNKNEPFIVSGGDDCKIKVWDLRELGSGVPVATFSHHKSPISTVEWHPSDSTVLAAGGEDDQITLWDLSVERDEGEGELQEIPPQLLFIHQGQQDVKELHWHPQLTGVVISTAQSGFNIFRTMSI